MFIVGGLSIAEIASVQQFEKDLGKKAIVLGSTDIFSAKEFL